MRAYDEPDCRSSTVMNSDSPATGTPAGRKAHALFPAELSERWHAVPRPENAGGYLANEGLGDPDVQRHVTTLAVGYALNITDLRTVTVRVIKTIF